MAFRSSVTHGVKLQKLRIDDMRAFTQLATIRDVSKDALHWMQCECYHFTHAMLNMIQEYVTKRGTTGMLINDDVVKSLLYNMQIAIEDTVHGLQEPVFDHRRYMCFLDSVLLYDKHHLVFQLSFASRMLLKATLECHVLEMCVAVYRLLEHRKRNVQSALPRLQLSDFQLLMLLRDVRVSVPPHLLQYLDHHH